MVETYKNIKEIAYTTILGGLLLLNVATTSLAQEGTIDDKVNGEMSNQLGISDKIEEIEQPEYLKELSDQINLDIHEDLANRLEIGGKPASKETINGIECYSVEGIDYAILKIKLGDDTPHSLPGIINYAISQGFKDAASILDYTPYEIKVLSNAIEQDGKVTYAYVKLKTELPKQNKEEWEWKKNICQKNNKKG